MVLVYGLALLAQNTQIGPGDAIRIADRFRETAASGVPGTVVHTKQ